MTIRRAHHSRTAGWSSTKRRQDSPAVMASVWRCRIIGMETTLIAKMSVANAAHTAAQVATKNRFCGSGSAHSEP